NITLAYVTADIVSAVDSNAAITAGGTVDVDARSHKFFSVISMAAAYNDGTTGVAVGIGEVNNTTSSTVGGSVVAGGPVGVTAGLLTDLNIVSASAQTGNGIIANLFGVAPGPSALTSWFGSKKPATDSKAGGSTALALSGAVAYSEERNDVTAAVKPSGSITSTGGRVDVLAHIVDQPQIASIASIDSNKFDD